MTQSSASAAPRFGMLINLATCVGCNACAVACKMENETPTACFNTWVESWDTGAYPDVRRANLSKLCNHCEDAPCQGVCPTGATYTVDEGVVLVNAGDCIGCKSCMTACPYGVRWYDEERNVVGKCTFCYHRTSKGMQPKCVSTCITNSRLFGDLNDPESDISRRLAEVDAERLHAELDGEVAVCYLGLSATQGAPVASGVCRGGVPVDN